jgi:hypothetical protein
MLVVRATKKLLDRLGRSRWSRDGHRPPDWAFVTDFRSGCRYRPDMDRWFRRSLRRATADG